MSDVASNPMVQTTPVRAAEGLSAEEFARLHTQHAPVLWCIAVGVTGDRELARDVVQEAAVIGLAKRSDFSVGTSFPHWMGQIVRFVALNQARRARQRAGISITPESAADTSAPAEPLGVTRTGDVRVDEDAFDDATTRALRTLDEVARSCLLMKTVLGMKYSTIAAALGIPENTAMSHVHRARRRMREMLGGRGGAA